MLDLIKSKKFIVALVGVIVTVLMHVIPELPQEATTEVITIIVAYVLGQGLADIGKEAKKVK